MKDFFQRQEHARSRTLALMGSFVLAVAGMVLCMYTFVRMVMYFNLSESMAEAGFPFWDYPTFAWVAIAMLVLIITGSLYKAWALSEGGATVAQMLGGRLVPLNTTDHAERRLLNIVEEMSIASGVPVPDVYVLDREGGINAFAAGRYLYDAVVCVTRGSLTLLSRDELQGVVAHEFSHVLNNDMRLNLRLMSLLHGMLLIGLIGESFVRGLRYSDGKGAAAIAMAGGVIWLIGYTGLFFGKMIKGAVSRQREYLADASAVQFTRNPAGLAGALKKIGGLSFGSKLLHPRAPEVSHMYFSRGTGAGLLSFLRTHPPLEERILRLDPAFDGKYPRVEARDLGGREKSSPDDWLAQMRAVPAMPAITGAGAMALLTSMGAPMKEHGEAARSLIGSMPPELVRATREPYSARALAYALVLAPDGQDRGRQVEILKSMVPPDMVEESLALWALVHGLDPRARLPLLDMSMPSFRRLSIEQYKPFRGALNKLMLEDRKFTLFEYTVRYLLVHRLDGYFKKSGKQSGQVYSIKGVVKEVSLALTMVARVGHRDEAVAEAAYIKGAWALGGGRLVEGFLERKQCTLKGLDAALEKLARTSPLVKKQFLAACLKSLMHDDVITVQEAELFRVFAEALDLPAPPWLVAHS